MRPATRRNISCTPVPGDIDEHAGTAAGAGFDSRSKGIHVEVTIHVTSLSQYRFTATPSGYVRFPF